MTHIIQCKVENIGGAKHIEFAPQGETVTIGGPNRAGKTSAINALVSALGGKSNLPADPVRHGAELGKVAIELSEFNVYLEVQPDRSSKLRVETKEGARFSSPQAMLDRLFGGLSFNPGSFRSMENKKRKAILMQLTGLDFADLDAKEVAAGEQRAYKKKRAAEIEAVGKSLPLDPDAPTSPVDTADILRQIEEIEATNRGIERTEYEYRQKTQEILQLKSKIAELNAAIDVLNKKLAVAQEEASELSECVPPKSDTAALKARLAMAASDNKRYEALQKRNQTIEQFKAARAEAKAAEDLVESIRKQRADRMAAAKFPIEGLAFTGEDVSFNGLPFAQLSESEQWEVSTAIGFALNPRGIVFMGNCGGLDAQARQRVRERAAAAGVQLFLEVVDDQKDVQILIEDGTVKESRI